MKEKLPFSKQIAYAIGQLGWSIVMGLINSYLVYFYLPPDGEGIPLWIPQGTILGFFTVIGLITMAGRFMDAITDPLIASKSDRSRSPKGRRVPFMAKGAIPLAVLTVMVFWSPVNGVSNWNVVWLTTTLLLFYIFYTIYVTPYFALISELGHTPEERLNLSTYISVTFFLGTAVASQAAVIWNVLEGFGLDKVLAMRLTFVALSAVATVFMLIPVWTIDERRYCDSVPSEVPLFKSLKQTFSNREFLVFTVSDMLYFLALTILTTGLMYYVTVLLGLEESFYSLLFILMGLGSFILYPLVNFLAKKFGKKKILVVAFAFFIVAFILPFFLGMDFITLDPKIQGYILVAIVAFPLAAFGILPNVIVADIAEYDAARTGSRREGIYFGARTFMSKVGQMISMLVFGWVLTFGKDAGNDLGVRISGPIGAAFCLLGLVFFTMYNEKKILGTKG